MAGPRSPRSRPSAAPQASASASRSTAGRATTRQLVSWVQEIPGQFAGLILNAGAYSHTSIALLDALRSSKNP